MPKKFSCFIVVIPGRAQLTTNDVIIFERPMQTKSYLVKGTVPEFRHVHLWTRRAP